MVTKTFGHQKKENHTGLERHKGESNMTHSFYFYGELKRKKKKKNLIMYNKKRSF